MKNLKVRFGVVFVFCAAIAIIVAASASAMLQPANPSLPPLPEAISKTVYVNKAHNPYMAPGFTLTDQRGKEVSLSQYRGKTVVLTFMDPHCVDICLMVSREFIMASHELGSESKNVVFLAINVNEYRNKVSDVLEFSKKEGLNNLPNWHFLTGSPAALKAMWQDYGIAVIPSKDGDVQHAAIIYFISPDGKVRYRGHPSFDKSSISDWAKAIAHYTKLSQQS